MAHTNSEGVGPSRDWQVPAATWPEIISRYVAFVQVPTWRATVKSDGSEKTGCISAEDATKIGEQMSRMVERLFSGHRRHSPSKRDLARIAKRQGRHISRNRRCSRKLAFHLQRALLLNAAGYTCFYCCRTAWGVYVEAAEGEPRRTLRFEIDHRTTRRRLPDPRAFDPDNLVVACRSCNTIKGEMQESRFRRELQSLASAVCRLDVKRH